MTFLMVRLARSPSAHLYHYAPYERTALRRLASMHAIAETMVDEILRTNRMIDLYRVVREGVRIGEPGYSIKKILSASTCSLALRRLFPVGIALLSMIAFVRQARPRS